MAWLMVALLLLPLVALAGVLFGVFDASEVEDPGSLAARAVQDFLEREPGLETMLWGAAVLLPLAAVFWLGQRTAVLRLTPSALEGHIPKWLGVGLFGLTAGDWQIPWHTIRGVRLVGPPPSPNPVQRLGRFRLVIETELGETWLSPFVWFQRSGPDHRLGLGEALHGRRLDAAQLVERAPLLRALRARGLEIEAVAADEERRPSGFDLTQHRGIAMQLVALFASGLYALLDTFFIGHYAPLENLPTLPFAVVAGCATLAVVHLGRGAPGPERLVVGALTITALTVAVYPATLRINGLTATPDTVTYVAAAPGLLESPGGALPDIDLRGQDLDEYWAQYEPGDEHEFTLLRGVGGFYQLDLAPLHARTRRFYSERDGAQEAADNGR